GTFFVFPGNVVTLTARPSSLLYVFAGWSGDLTGSAASQSVTVGGSQSIVARFAPNWAFMAAMGTVGAMAGATLAVVLRRRRRKGKFAAAEPGTPPAATEGEACGGRAGHASFASPGGSVYLACRPWITRISCEEAHVFETK